MQFMLNFKKWNLQQIPGKCPRIYFVYSAFWFIYFYYKNKCKKTKFSKDITKLNVLECF